MPVCREWHGAKVKGYGYRWDRKRKRVVLIHRWVVAQLLGWDAIEGKVVIHTCDNPACYLYEHLRVGTQQENMRDALDKGRTRGSFIAGQTHCQRGHPFDESNTYIAPNGRRQCRRCRADASARCYHRKRGELCQS